MKANEFVALTPSRPAGIHRCMCVLSSARKKERKRQAEEDAAAQGNQLANILFNGMCLRSGVCVASWVCLYFLAYGRACLALALSALCQRLVRRVASDSNCIDI